jgi:hypothetical protein
MFASLRLSLTQGNSIHTEEHLLYGELLFASKLSFPSIHSTTYQESKDVPAAPSSLLTVQAAAAA